MLHVLAATLALRATPSWDSILEKLCAKPAGFRAILSAGEHANVQLLKWFESAGVRAKIDSRGRQVPGVGLCLFQDGKIVPVKGLPDAALLATDLYDSRGNCDDVPLLEVFQLVRGRLRTQPVDMKGMEDPMPVHAAMVAGRLVAVGRVNWYSNAPSAALASYRLSKGRWRLASMIQSDYEVVRLPPIRTSRAGEILPLRVISRTDTDTLNLCHATAQVEMEEQWSVRRGKLHRDWTRRPATPFNRFVDLVDLLRTGRDRGARAYCANRAVYSKVRRMEDELTGHASVRFKGDYCSVDGTDFGLDGVCILHWVKQKGTWVIGRVDPPLSD